MKALYLFVAFIIIAADVLAGNALNMNPGAKPLKITPQQTNRLTPEESKAIAVSIMTGAPMPAKRCFDQDFREPCTSQSINCIEIAPNMPGTGKPCYIDAHGRAYIKPESMPDTRVRRSQIEDAAQQSQPDVPDLTQSVQPQQ